MPVEALSQSNLKAVVEIEAQSPGTNWTEDMIRGVMTDAYMRGIVWTESGQVAGYCIYGVLAPTLEILNIVIASRHRRHGIARKLMTHIFAQGKDEQCGEAFLEVRVSNAAAIRLYESLNFKVINTRKKYYSDGEDGLVMGTPLM